MNSIIVAIRTAAQVFWTVRKFFRDAAIGTITIFIGYNKGINKILLYCNLSTWFVPGELSAQLSSFFSVNENSSTMSIFSVSFEASTAYSALTS